MLWGKKGQKDSKSQWIREFAARLYIPIISEMTSIKSHQYDILSMIWTRMTAMGMPKWTRESLWVFNPTQRTIGTWGKLGAEVAFPGEGHTNWQSRAKWSTLKQKDINITQTKQFIFRSVCVCKSISQRYELWIFKELELFAYEDFWSWMCFELLGGNITFGSRNRKLQV